MTTFIALVVAALALWFMTDGVAWLHHRFAKARKPVAEADPAERGELEYPELASDDGDGHAARAVEARLAHDAHLRRRQPLAIEAAPRDRRGATDA